MPVFIELATDPFEEILTAQSSRRTLTGRSTSAGSRVARRPTRGLELKEDTYAALKVILSDGTELPLVDSSSPDGYSTRGYTNFILQSVTEARMEKTQIVETFGQAYIYFFGENPRFLDVTCVLLNSHDFNWEAEWWENYEQNLRGTKLTEKGGRLYMFYDDTVVEGYMLMTQASKSSDQQFLCQMTFRLFLTNYRNVSFIGDPNFPVHESVIIQGTADVPNTLLGPSRENATSAGAADRSDLLARTASNGSFAQAPRLADLLRDASRQGAITPAARSQLDRIGVGPLDGRSLPVRSRIADNLDEYVGLGVNQLAQAGVVATPGSGSGQNSSMSPADRSHLEVDDLHQSTITELSKHGANVNGPDQLAALGLMPNFESDARAPATFRPQEKEPFGFDTAKEQVADNPVDSVASFRQDPLGAVFGGAVNAGFGTGTPDSQRLGDNRFTQGAGDPRYGFHSDFAKGPGFGEVGFGDFGGGGFGSGQGAAGDPGFKDPSRFTFAGVVQKQAAFAKFRRTKPDQTAFGKGAGIGAGSSGLSGGAGVHIGGKPSAFSVVSVGGTLTL